MAPRIKYLEEIGVCPSAIIDSNKYHDLESDSRDELFESQRTEFGFDERETWDLRYTSACWLYSRLKMYVDVASKIVDLEYWKYDIDGEEKTQLEVINEMIRLLESHIKYENNTDISESLSSDELGELEKESESNLKKAFELYSKIVEQMWW